MSDSKNEECAEQVVEPPPSLPTVTEQQRELGSQSIKEFENHQYGPCMSILNKLMNQRPTDVKVIHNKAVAEFYHGGLRYVEDFKRKLNTVPISPDVFDSLEDMDHAFVYYNQSVILYHHRQYRAALNLLDKLFQCIEALEETLARHVLLLLVELYVCTFQPEKAMGVLTFMEKTYFNGKHSGNQGTPDKPEKGDNKDKYASDNEIWKPRISLYKIRCLIMLKSMKLCKRELKSLLSGQGMNTSTIYLKSNFEYLRGNHRKAIKMLGSDPQAQVFTNTGECLPMMYFNNLGCIHFHLRKHHLGAFHFRRAVQENENSLKEASSGGSNKPLQTRGMSRHHELLYNMGIQLLHCGKPQSAFDCLIEAVQVYRVNPRLWLRLAECCIQANRENNDEDRNLDKRLEVIQGSVGSGIHRKLILGTGVSKIKPSSATPSMPSATLEFASLCLRNALLLLPEDPLETEKTSTQTDEQGEGRSTPEPVLVGAPPGNPMKAVEVAHLRCAILAASAYVSLCLNDHLMALQYSEALLKQPHISGAQKYLGHLYTAEAQVQLDKIPSSIDHMNPELVTDISVCPPEHKADQEKGEKNDKGEKDLLAESTEAKSALYPWFPKDISRAKAVMQYNLAAAHAMRGEYEKAMTLLTESSRNIGTPLPSQMFFLKLYLDLMEGRRKMAQYVIKDHFGHVTPNRV